MNRIDKIKEELATLDSVNSNSYNNEGLYNEMRIMREKLEIELAELEKEATDGSKKSR